MADRLAECRADMRAIHQAADEIGRTLEAVSVMNTPEVWAGPAGDRFRSEWNRHQSAIRSALQEIRGQTDAILARVTREENKG